MAASTPEDAVQEALLAAALRWPDAGVPENPRGWLVAVASRRLIDELRADHARQRREDSLSIAEPAREVVPAPGDDSVAGQDDSLSLLFLCCHPSLTPPSQIALTLRAVGGLTTGQIAGAVFVPEATMAQRISRAKETIRSSGIRFEPPPAEERTERLRVVEQVLYLIFNEGYTATSGPALQHVELATEAIRLTRLLRRLLPEDGEVAGLLALMLLTHARHDARVAPDGAAVPLGEQDRALWDQAAIAEGVAVVSAALARAPLGPYQLQAAIAAVHAEAKRAQDTDWREILVLYELLEQIAPSPIVTLNRAVALAMVHGSQAGLELLASITSDERLRRSHRLAVVRAHLLEMAGDRDAAGEAFRLAARLATNLPERRYLEAQVSRVAGLLDVEMGGLAPTG